MFIRSAFLYNEPAKRATDMAAKTWSDDFRSSAINSSISRLPDRNEDDVFGWPSSFCLPVSDRPVVGFTPGKLTLILLALGFVLLGLAVWLTGNEDDPAAWRMILAAASGISGMACFFAPAVFAKQIAFLFLQQRGWRLHSMASPEKLMTSELSDGAVGKQKIEIDGDDYVLIFMDKANQRILMEGIAARYQIRSEDVISVEDFMFINYVGARIRCRIGEDAELCFAIAKVSILFELTRQLPFLIFLRKRIRNRLLEESLLTLGTGSDTDDR